MIRGAGTQFELFARIDRWKQEVENSTKQSPLQEYRPHCMKLRSGHTRPALAETSGNQYSRKRKASATTGDIPAAKKSKKGVTTEIIDGGPRRSRRGRPAKNQQANTQVVNHMAQAPPGRSGRGPGRPKKTAELANLLESDVPDFSHSLPSRGSSASRGKGSRSPSKRGQITLDKPTSEAAIDMKYLARCEPAVVLTTFGRLKGAQKAISSVVLDLFQELRNIPHGLIPSVLQLEYAHDANTPRKSRESHEKSYFLEPEKTPFPKNCLGRMKSTADKVLEKAQWTQSQNAHERQWGVLVTQLLCEVEMWQKEPTQIVVLNVETCSIQPEEVRPMRPDTKTHIDCDAQTVTSDSKSKSYPESLGRMVDWCLGFNVDEADMAVIRKAYANIADNAASLNQSLSYIRDTPLILDIEIKKTLQPRDPQVQLAIWASSALGKKQLMGWDRSMPMPAIAVNGHLWEFYIFFEMDANLIMAGPYHFGTTADTNGIWAIFYRLHIIMNWGMTTYKDWFKKQIVAWAQRGADGEKEVVDDMG